MTDPRTPDELWQDGAEHSNLAVAVRNYIESIQQVTDLGYSFGGDGDNGEEFLYLLDGYVQSRTEIV